MPLWTQIVVVMLGCAGYHYVSTYSRWGWWLLAAGALAGFVAGLNGFGPQSLSTPILCGDLAFIALPIGRKHPISRMAAWAVASLSFVGLLTGGGVITAFVGLGAVANTWKLTRQPAALTASPR